MVAYLSTQMIRAMHTMVTITTAVKAAPTATAISPPRGRPSDFSKVGASFVWFTPDPVADVATVVARGPTRRLVTDVAKVGASVWFTPDPVADVATAVARGPTRRLVTDVAKVGASVVWFTPDPVADVATVVARGPTRRLVTEVFKSSTSLGVCRMFPRRRGHKSGRGIKNFSRAPA